MIEAYFDESEEGEAGAGILTVCGYALESDGAAGLIEDWREMKTRYGLEFFRMSDCNSRTGAFAHLDERQCDECARLAIRIARTYPLHGWAIVLEQSDYRGILQDQGFACDPYSFMAWTLFIHINKWLHTAGRDDDIALFFERGYLTGERADELLKAVSGDKIAGKPSRVVAHAFIDKEKSDPAQAADLVAWHVRKAHQNTKEGKPIRKDTLALLEDRNVWTIFYTPEMLRSIRDDFTQKRGSLKAASDAIFSRPAETTVR